MNDLPPTHARRRHAVACATVIVALLLSACAGAVLRPVPLPGTAWHAMSVGPREVVLDALALRAAGLKAWPDGNLGVLREGSRYTFFAANSSSVGRTVGTLSDPIADSVEPALRIQGVKGRYDYTAGGPVYRDPASGVLLMIYHAEKWIRGRPAAFWSLLGMARSVDGGRTWMDLGEIISPHVPFDTTLHEITGGTFAVVGEHFYVYFRDIVSADTGVTTNNLAMARARVADVLAAALEGEAATWVKYHDGTWTEPGLGGRSSPLERGNPGSNFMSVSYNHHIGLYVLVVVDVGGDDWDLWLATSPDGLVWSDRIPVERETGESYAPTIIGLGPEPRDSDRDLYVYYAFSERGSAGRWKDTVLARRRITLH